MIIITQSRPARFALRLVTGIATSAQTTFAAHTFTVTKTCNFA
ncbi:MAG TPA: hypothetical protein VJR22_03860 [Candidatus Nitrosotalea sp.]|nr:hypothetical protein [Candidatus Nitrosotalea sp.]